MLRFALSRLLSAIPTLLVLVVLAFFMMRAAPGGPFDTERTLPPEVQAQLEAQYRWWLAWPPAPGPRCDRTGWQTTPS